MKIKLGVCFGDLGVLESEFTSSGSFHESLGWLSTGTFRLGLQSQIVVCHLTRFRKISLVAYKTKYCITAVAEGDSRVLD